MPWTPHTPSWTDRPSKKQSGRIQQVRKPRKKRSRR